MKCLVLGGGSLKGQEMARFLSRMGQQVTVTTLPQEPLDCGADCRVLRADLLDPQAIEDALRQAEPDYVFDFAAQNSVGHAWADPSGTIDVNVIGAINLFDAVRKLEHQPIVVLSGSGDEYGNEGFSLMPLAEETGLNPSNVFAVSKACQTMLAQIYHRAYGMKLIVARMFNDIGVGQSRRFAISDFCCQAAQIEKGLIEPVIHVGNLNTMRDFVDIRDQVRACWMLAQHGRNGEIYNVGTGHAVSMRTVLELITGQLSMDVRLCVDRERIRPVDIPKLEADIFKLQRDTGWKAEITLEQSIRDILNYWRARV